MKPKCRNLTSRKLNYAFFLSNLLRKVRTRILPKGHRALERISWRTLVIVLCFAPPRNWVHSAGSSLETTNDFSSVIYTTHTVPVRCSVLKSPERILPTATRKDKTRLTQFRFDIFLLTWPKKTNKEVTVVCLVWWTSLNSIATTCVKLCTNVAYSVFTGNFQKYISRKRLELLSLKTQSKINNTELT